MEKKASKLLSILPRRGPLAYEKFLEALRDTSQSFLADRLAVESGKLPLVQPMDGEQ